MEDVNFEVSSKNLLLESATELNTDISQKKRSSIIAQKRAQASQCFQSLAEFNATVDSLSEENWCSQALGSDSDDTLFASCKLNLSLTPPKTIVEQILHDFCSSPLSPSSEALEEHLKMPQFYRSPCFRFTHKNFRVYSNKKRRKLFENEFSGEKEEQEKEVCICEDDDCLSISSGLSVQEDLTQTETEIECGDNRCSLNKSQNIYENLLNLSAFFTQRTADPLVKTEMCQTNIDVVEETLDRQQIEYEITTTTSNDDLHINGVSRTWLSEGESDSMSDTSECNKVASRKVVTEEAPLFSDDEGDQYFINFNSQDVLESRIKLMNTKSATNVETDFPLKFEGFQTAGKNTIKISEAARERASKLLADVIELKPNTEAEIDVNLKEMKLSCGGFQTAGKKAIKISEASKSRASKLLADVMELKLDDDEKNDIPSVLPTELPNGNNLQFGSFQTAGKKAIKISEESKSRASKLIADVMELESAENKSLHSEKRIPNALKENEHNFEEFKTAGKKSIRISEESKSRASKIIANVLDEDLGMSDEKEEDFKGFPEKTHPNSKLIKYSDKNLISENMHNDVLEEFADIQFSEWPHDKEVITSQPKDDIPEPPLPMLDITDSKSNTISNISNLSRDGNGKFISRKNLLSLSNRRKRTNTKDNNPLKTKINDKQEFNVTPKDKMLGSVERYSTPGSHNPFLELPVSSTPTSNMKALDLVLEAKRSQLNNSSSKKTPTASERMEYLRRYGDPPDLSPIPNLTPKGVDNCRPSGLRRNIKK